MCLFVKGILSNWSKNFIGEIQPPLITSLQQFTLSQKEMVLSKKKNRKSKGEYMLQKKK